MCGIAGFLGSGGQQPDSAQLASRMADRLVHRGPDDSGVWADSDEHLALSHRRLAIIDLSPGGHQPMIANDLVIVFNGEIYNYLDLRTDLERQGHRFRSDSDTEVLLALIEAYGVSEAIRRCHGMFAFALWDKREKKLTLARDRFGEKPLYYGVFAKTLVFASELPALAAHPLWEGQINRSALGLYFRHNCVPQPLSIFQGVSQVRPGHFVTVQAGRDFSRLDEVTYWDPVQTWRDMRTRTIEAEPASLIDEFRLRFGAAVARQLCADVPLGAFLSGGIDSSLVVAMMQQASTRPVRTFTIGFQEDEFNESVYARQVAEHLGTEHTEVMLSATDARDLIPDLASIYGEPFADSSQLPTLLVSKVTREHVTVALTGDGGDEFYGGYSRYLDTVKQWSKVSARPAAIRSAVWGLARILPDPMMSMLAKLAGQPTDIASGDGAAIRVADRLAYDTGSSLPEYYLGQMSFWHNKSRLVRGLGGNDSRGTEFDGLFDEAGDAFDWMMFRDSQTYLNDDILTKVDRAAMHYSLETRAPFLDHELVEFAWRLPSNVHFRDGSGKWLSRQALKAFLPDQLIDRPKMGFAIPLGHWLRTDLRDWAESLLHQACKRRELGLNVHEITARWQFHLRGDDRYAFSLWAVITFESWWQKWISR